MKRFTKKDISLIVLSILLVFTISILFVQMNNDDKSDLGTTTSSSEKIPDTTVRDSIDDFNNAQIETNSKEAIELLNSTVKEEITKKESTTKKSSDKQENTTTVKESTTKNVTETTTEDALTEKWFISQYNLGKQQYIDELNEDIKEKESEIAYWESCKSDLYDSYSSERSEILKRYPDSATRDTMLYNAQQNYASSVKGYNDRIEQLENEIDELETEKANPNVDKILTIVTKNCNITSRETYEYYNKYSNKLN